MHTAPPEARSAPFPSTRDALTSTNKTSKGTLEVPNTFIPGSFNSYEDYEDEEAENYNAISISDGESENYDAGI